MNRYMVLLCVVLSVLGHTVSGETNIVYHYGGTNVFVSGYTDEAISRTGILPDDVELLSKPFHPKALLTLVRTVLDREH